MKETSFKDSKLGYIPIDWNVVTLKDICQTVTKGTTPPCFTSNGVRYVKIESFINGKIEKSLCSYVDEQIHETFLKRSILKENDILFAIAGATVGKNAMVTQDCLPANTNQALAIIRLKNGVNHLYIYGILNSKIKEDYIRMCVKTGAQPNLTLEQINCFLVPLPQTLEEQTRIATALSDMDSLIQKTEELLEKKRNIKQGTMQQLLTGKKRLKGFTGEWKEKKLGDFVDIYRGGSPRPIEAYITQSPDGINWIKIGDVSSDAKYINNTQEKIIKKGINYSRQVQKGDFILSNSMSFGRPYILNIEGCIHDGWLVIKNYQKTYDKDFLYYVLGSKDVMQQYVAMAAGSSVQNLNKEKVSKVIIYAPEEKKEQQAIATILSDMDKEIEEIEQKLIKLRDIKQGMMQQLLTGKIRLV